MSKKILKENVIITPYLPPRVFRQYLLDPENWEDGVFSFVSDKNISVARFGIGAEAADKCVRMLATRGCRNIFFLGSCGGLETEEIGKLLSVEAAYFGTRDNVSGPYAADKELCGLLAQKTGAEKARIFSVESLAKETEGLIKKLQADNFKGIDMEAGPVLKAATECRLKACALVYTTDIPLLKPYTSELCQKDRKAIESSRDNAVRSLVELVKSLNGNYQRIERI